jgi:ParB family chromosome partitioning protein
LGPELRTAAPAHATGAVVFVPLEEIAPDECFRLRPDGEVELLAASIGRLGQLTPLELRPWPGAAAGGPRWQVLAGFRRLAALRMLLRDQVLARVHQAISDEDAWALALTPALLAEPLSQADLAALRQRLSGTPAAPWALELADEALVRAPLPAGQRERFYEFLRGPLPAPAAAADAGGGEVRDQAAAPADAAEPTEVDADDFARDLALHMAELNQDLATAYGAWKDLPAEGRRLVLIQARYVAELLPYLEGADR